MLPFYSLEMRKRVKATLLILATLMACLAAAVVVLFLWFSRPATTQLVDAAGQKLTAGPASDSSDEEEGEASFAEVEALIAEREFDAAKEKLLEIVVASDRDGAACILLSDVTRELEDVDAAVDYGLKAVTLLPDSSAAHLAYAKALGAQIFNEMQGLSGMLSAMAKLGTFKEHINRAIALDPDDIEARSMLVFTNMAPAPFGNIEQAIEICREIEQRDPVVGRQLLAMCYRKKEDLPRAISILRSGIEEYPEEPGFHEALADIYAEQQRFDEADTEYTAALRGDKNESYYRALYGQARMRIQNEYEPRRAVELLDVFIADAPDFDGVPTVAHAWWRKGNALEQLGRGEDARAAYEESLRQDPDLELAREALAAMDG